MTRGFAADHTGATARPSPNFGERRNAIKPAMIVLHYTGMKEGRVAEDWLCDDRSQVSAHYVVHEDGRIVQLVSEKHRAWHAGKSCWRGQSDINSASIGIEIVNPGHLFGYPDFPDAQIEALIDLCLGVGQRWSIKPELVLAHSDVAPGRKIDPGEKFPWDRLHKAGVGHYVEPAAIEEDGRTRQELPIERLQRMLAEYGYGIDETGAIDDQTRIVVEAFQRHFRQAKVDGIPDHSTVATLRALLAGIGKDRV